MSWYREAFDETYLRIYEPLLDAERTADEVDAVEDLLRLDGRTRILDLACGHGRHANLLAARGHEVVGVDLAQHFLQRARTAVDTGRAVTGHGRARFVRADLRALPFPDSTFPVAVSLFNSFGYLEDDSQDQQVLAEVRRVLAPGGRLLLEVEHRDSLLVSWADTEAYRGDDGLLVVEERRWDASRGRKQVDLTVLLPEGAVVRQHHDVRVYAATELEAMARRAGLRVDGCFGDTDGSPLTLSSASCWLVLTGV